MDVVSTCPLPVASVLWQPRAGKWTLTFVCKATYRLAPTESELASEQEPPNEDDNFWDDDATRSLYAPSDLVPFKARADVILVGNAFAPRRDPVRSLIAQLIVGQMTKSIECFCDRMWTLDGQLREGPKFTKLPLRYERAGGGPDTTNPVGMRPDAADAYGMLYLPNLQQPADPVPKRGDVVEPIGFGPIAPAWPSRVQRLGRHAATWFEGAWNSRPLPEDLDPSFFNCAPLDQQVDAIRTGERLILENLHPEHPRLVTNLPAATPRAVLERPGAAPEAVKLMCDTLWIDTDRSLCTLVYRGRVALDHRAQQGRVVVSMDAPTSARAPQVEAPRLAWSKEPPPKPPPLGASPRARPAAAPHIEEDETHVSQGRDPADVLPFVPGGASPGGASISGAPAAGGVAPSVLDDDEDPWRDTTAALAVNPARSAPLPFSGSSDPKAPTLPFQPRPKLPPVPKPDATSPGPRPTLVGMPIPPPSSAGQAPPAPPPIVRPPPPVEPLAPAAPTSPWATGKAPGFGSPPPLPVRSPAPAAPIAPEPASKGASFLPKFDPKFDTPAPVVPSAAAAAAAATSGAAAASNAAAAVNARGTPSPAARPAEPAARPGGREILTLLWFDPTFVKPMTDHKQWAKILEQRDDEDDEKPSEPPKPDISADDDGADDDAGEDADDPDMYVRDEPEEPPPEEDVPQEVLDRRNVFKILARGEPITAAAIDAEVAGAIRRDGTLEPPLVLLSGDLLFPFDELETLKATVTAVSPLVAGDKKLKEVVDTVNELLKTPWLSRSGAVAEGQTARIKEAFGQGNRMVPASYLDSHTERILLEERHYQKRTVFGQTWIRSLYVSASSPDQIPAYLPESLTKQLPMFQRLRMRLIAEVHMQQDQYESHPIALRVVALARVSVLAPRASTGGAGGKPS
jgi:hypothetical protein